MRVVVREDFPEEVTQLRPKGHKESAGMGKEGERRTRAKVLEQEQAGHVGGTVQRWVYLGQVRQER